MTISEFTGLKGQYGAILIDPPWRFANRTGKMAPEHKRLRRYPTMDFGEIASLPVGRHALPKATCTSGARTPSFSKHSR